MKLLSPHHAKIGKQRLRATSLSLGPVWTDERGNTAASRSVARAIRARSQGAGAIVASASLLRWRATRGTDGCVFGFSGGGLAGGELSGESGFGYVSFVVVGLYLVSPSCQVTKAYLVSLSRIVLSENETFLVFISISYLSRIPHRILGLAAADDVFWSRIA